MLKISWSPLPLSLPRRIFLFLPFWLFLLGDCHHRMALLHQRKVEGLAAAGSDQ